MFKTKFKYSLDTQKQIVSVRPTIGTIAKAYVPTLVGLGIVWAVLTVSEKQLTRETEDFLKNEENLEK